MNETFIAPAKQLSVALQAFHRALIRAEIGDDPALQNPYTQLFALIGDPRFAWMGAISQLIARIDHSVVEGEMDEPGVLAGFHRDAAALLGEGEGDIDSQFRLRHLIALQNEPEVGLATGKLRKALAVVGAAIEGDQ
ncbi:hypothetical protein [Mesorhizobium sp. CAU 1732]|uniref:hypothetical protein n=1 Tax=Mesorhizobium sp. CAU 1732 TaxID=3140358 RepID=UPI0032614426